jgi:hypothetical protein
MPSPTEREVCYFRMLRTTITSTNNSAIDRSKSTTRRTAGAVSASAAGIVVFASLVLGWAFST